MARLFSLASVDFWQQVSQRNASGAEFRGNVKPPAIVFNTLGSHGTVVFERITGLSTCTDQNDPGRPFADLQAQIAHDSSQMVAGKQMGEFVKRHRTLSAPGDTVALMQPTDTQGKRPAFTTERQFAVTGHMAMPVLDAIANDLERRFNIDLVAAPTRPRSMPAARPTWAASSARPVATSRRSAPTRWTA